MSRPSMAAQARGPQFTCFTSTKVQILAPVPALYSGTQARKRLALNGRRAAPAYVSIRQHAPAYVSIRQHTPLSGLLLNLVPLL